MIDIWTPTLSGYSDQGIFFLRNKICETNYRHENTAFTSDPQTTGTVWINRILRE